MTVNHWVAGSSPAGGADLLIRHLEFIHLTQFSNFRKRKFSISLNFSCQFPPISRFFLCFFLFLTKLDVFPEGNPAKFPLPQSFFQSEQVVIVIGRPGETQGKLHLFTLVNGEWRTDLEDVPVWFGRSGLTLSEHKREGDGFTPEGYFPIKRILGKGKNSIRHLEYTQIRKFHFWNDDPKSKHYNQLVSKKEKGAHSLWDSEIYELFVVIEHNTNPSFSGMGSMIFLHPWKETKPTSGCVGVNRDMLFKIVETLNGKKNPYLVITSSAEN